MGSERYTSYIEARARTSPLGSDERFSRQNIIDQFQHIRQEMPKLFAAHSLRPDHPLRQAHERMMSAVDAWRQSSGDFEADKALHASFMEYGRTLHGFARSTTDPTLRKDLMNHMQDFNTARSDHTRRAQLDNPHLPTVGVGPDAFWRWNAPELYPNAGHSGRGDEIRGGWVEPERAWRTGGLPLPIPADLPRLQFAEAGPALANLGRPADRVAPDPDIERVRSTG